MKKLSILSLLLVMVAMAAQAKPGICRVNGVEMLEKGKTLEGNEKALFLQGIVCATPEVLDRAEVSISDLKGIPMGEKVFIRARLDVKYDKQEMRFDETYVVTYKQEPGIIDGMLAFHEKDMMYCDGSFKAPRDMHYQFSPGSAELEFSAQGFDVERHYAAYMGQNGGTSIEEQGAVIYHYVFDNAGSIVPAAEPHTYKVKHKVTRHNGVPNRSPKDDEFYEDDKPQLLGPGTAVIAFFTKSVAKQNDEWLNQLNKNLESLDKGALPPKTVELLRNGFMRWEKFMMCRDAAWWLNWLKANNTTQIYQHFQTFLSEDEQFAQWVKGQATALKDKKARKWWKNALK